ncbi:hypothetical protein [Natronorubrum halophilum]|uniref:hypothetical protein n=1 Tax=Natronorubrum halophilum TaxID=1702106 RepID=UPI000EF74601|nr:hypothetical protein [Natronorubrum halophilum]
MNESRVVGLLLLLAISLAAVASAATESVAILGGSPIGLAIYLAVGIGLPQYVLARQTGSPLRLGVALFAVGAAVLSILAGVAMGTVTEEWGFGIVPILLLVVFGVLIGRSVDELRAGYRSRS